MSKLTGRMVIGAVSVAVLSSAALAGNIQVRAEMGGAAVSGATVSAEPAHLAGTTNPAGKCTLGPIAASTQRVVAFANIAGVHYAAVADGVAVPAHGNVDVALVLAQAVEMPLYMPFDLGRYWRYACHDARGDHVREEDVVRPCVVAGRNAFEVATRIIGTTDGWVDRETSDADGFWQFGRNEGHGWVMFAPPAMYPNHFSLGYTWKQEFDAVDGLGHVLRHETSALRLVAFERVTVPAGTFDCAKLEGAFTHGAERQRTTIWLAPKTGVVRMIERKAGDTLERNLAETGHRAAPLHPVIPAPPGLLP